jgi:hypothetical protein
LRSPFESSLDLLNHDRMVLIRKTSGGLHLLTESSQITRFSGLAKDYQALSGAYLVAELLGDWVEENDPHPGLFDAAIGCLKDLEQAACAEGETEKGMPKWNPSSTWGIGPNSLVVSAVRKRRRRVQRLLLLVQAVWSAGVVAWISVVGGSCRNDAGNWREIWSR